MKRTGLKKPRSHVFNMGLRPAVMQSDILHDGGAEPQSSPGSYQAHPSSGASVKSLK